jgi:hypothetical protein
MTMLPARVTNMALSMLCCIHTMISEDSYTAQVQCTKGKTQERAGYHGMLLT